MSFMEKLFGTFSDKELKRIKPLADKVLALEPEMQKLTDAELQAKTPALKEKLKNGATLDEILPEAFAVCREADWRVLGLKPYPVQIIGGIVLHRACIAEMQTRNGSHQELHPPSHALDKHEMPVRHENRKDYPGKTCTCSKVCDHSPWLCHLHESWTPGS